MVSALDLISTCGFYLRCHGLATSVHVGSPRVRRFLGNNAVIHGVRCFSTWRTSSRNG